MIIFAKSSLANITISPFYLEFDADAKKRSDIVRVVNTTAKKQTYRIKLINYKQQEDGSYKEIEGENASGLFADKYLDFSPHETTLEPRQSQTIRVYRRPMPTAKEGEYVSHLLIQEKDDNFVGDGTVNKGEMKVELKALYGVTIPIIITKGKLDYSAEIKSAQIVEEGGRFFVKTTVTRSGNRSFYGTINVKEGKKDVGVVKNFRILANSPQRIVYVPLEVRPSNKLQVNLSDARTDEVVFSKKL